MISTQQIKILQTLLNVRFKDREARLAFLSDFVFRELSSIKELKEAEAFEIMEYLKYDFSRYALFDNDNPQHRSLLAKCHELGWVQAQNPKIVNLQQLGKWLLSKRCPVQKTLLKMTTKEVSKVIGALEKIMEKKYHSLIPKKKNACKHKRQVLRTIDGYCTVTVTAVFCADCGMQLTKTALSC